MDSSWLGAWLLWWTWYAAELRFQAYVIELFERYNTPAFRKLRALSLRESPIMQRLVRGQ